MVLVAPQQLMDGELLVEGRLVDASNATLFAKISSARSDEIAIVYKPIAGERPLWDFPNGNLASREVASFLISEAGGFHCVPTTVMRDGPFGIGAVQQWIDVDESIDVIELGQSDARSIRNLALFDAVVNNTDRKFGHILPISRNEVYGCDHGVTLHEESKLRTVIWQFSGQELTEEERVRLAMVRRFVTDDSALDHLISIDEREAILHRITGLEAGGFPEPSEEWPAVPWPPV